MKLPLRYLFLVSLCLKAIGSYSQWNLLTTLNANLKDVIFISNDTGIACYSYNTTPPGPMPSPAAFISVDKTTNSAASWSTILLNSDYNPSGVVSYNVTAVKNTTTCFYIQTYHQYVYVNRYNGSWSSGVNAGTVGFVDFSAPDVQHWFLLRGYGSKYYVSRSQNGVIKSSLDSFTLQKPALIFFADSLTGYVAASNTTYTNTHMILKSTTGGTGWTSVFSDPSVTIKRMYFISPDTGYVACNSGKVLKTTDGGLSWQYLNTGITNNLNAIYFINSNTGFAAGDAGTIIRTTNGGSTWSIDTTGVTTAFTKIFFVNDSVGFARTGTSVYRTGVSIVPTGIEEKTIENKLVVYPNPAVASCTVKMPSDLQQESILMMYDSSGKLLTEASIKKQQAELTVDLTGYEPGNYYLVLKSKKKTYTGKVVHN